MDTFEGSNHTLAFYDKDVASRLPPERENCSASLVGLEPCCLRVGNATELQLSLRLENFAPDGFAVPLCIRILVQDNVLVEQICDVESGRKVQVFRLPVPPLPQGQARLLVSKRNCTGRVHVSYPLLVLPANACNEVKRVQMSMLQRYRRQGMEVEWACCKVLEKHFIPFLEDFAAVQLLCGPPAGSASVRLPPAKILEVSCRVLTFLKGNAMWECLVTLLLLSDRHKDSQLHARLQDVGITFQQLLEKVSDRSFSHMFQPTSASSDKSSSPPASPTSPSPSLSPSHPPQSPPPAPVDPDQSPDSSPLNQDLPAWISAYLSAVKGQFTSKDEEQTYQQQYQRRWFAGVDTVMVCSYLLSGLMLLLAYPVTAGSLAAAAAQLVVCMLRMLLYVGMKHRPLHVRHASLSVVLLVILLSGKGPALVPSIFHSLSLSGILPPLQVPVLHQLGLSVLAGLLSASPMATPYWTVATLALSIAITLLQDFFMRLHFLTYQRVKQD